MEILQTKIGSFTLLQLILGAVAALVLLAVVRAILASMKGGQPDAHHARRRCLNCGWTGTVSKHKPRCGKCGNTSLEPA